MFYFYSVLHFSLFFNCWVEIYSPASLRDAWGWRQRPSGSFLSSCPIGAVTVRNDNVPDVQYEWIGCLYLWPSQPLTFSMVWKVSCKYSLHLSRGRGVASLRWGVTRPGLQVSAGFFLSGGLWSQEVGAAQNLQQLAWVLGGVIFGWFSLSPTLGVWGRDLTG